MASVARCARWWLVALILGKAAEVASAVAVQRSGESDWLPRPLVRVEGHGDDGAPASGLGSRAEPDSLAVVASADARAERNLPEYQAASFDLEALVSEDELFALFAKGNEANDTPEQTEKRKAAESALSAIVMSSDFGFNAPPTKKRKVVPAIPSIQPGDTIVGFVRPAKTEIGHEIAKGSFATVFEGMLDLGKPTKVAVKQDNGKPRAITLEAEFLFMRDFYVAAKHLALYPHFVDISQGVLVMELGSFDLLHWIVQADRHLAWNQHTPLEQVRGMMFDVLEGIAAMHHRGYAHRDLKPDNFLFVCGGHIDGHCRLKFSDFGLSCAFGLTEDRELQKYRCDPKHKAGTLAFLPPELRLPSHPDRSHPHTPPRQDVWAAGVLFAMLLEPRLVSNEFASQIYKRPIIYINEIVSRRPDLQTDPLGQTMQHTLRSMLQPDPDRRCPAYTCVEKLNR